MPTRDTTPLVAVDIGNSSMKLGVFAGRGDDSLREPSSTLSLPLNAGALAQLPEWLPPAATWAVASVNGPACERLAQWVESERPGDTFRLLGREDFHLPLVVERPEQVGLDRIAAAAAANGLRSAGQPAIVVDGGTAFTVNVVSAEGAFCGGAILPGFRLAAASLANNTDALPLVKFDAARLPSVIGLNTEAALYSGLFWGSVGGLKELVRRTAAELPGEPELFLTGGGADLLVDLLDRPARYVPHLVLTGIALAHAYVVAAES